ncbi:MAG: hypothetical protein JWM20_253 [Patescibacteria group bacterium]|nr:hypothetical protein [Patescibacteria group bacterium]
MQHYWANHHHKLPDLKSFEEMVILAHEVIDAISGEVAMVSGPISTGGLGSREANLIRLDEAITSLVSEGHIIFDQAPFDTKMNEFVAHIKEGYPMPILEEFYLPLFKSGKIKKFFFVPGWESSTGASWEHDRAKELGIEIIYLD